MSHLQKTTAHTAWGCPSTVSSPATPARRLHPDCPPPRCHKPAPSLALPPAPRTARCNLCWRRPRGKTTSPTGSPRTAGRRSHPTRCSGRTPPPPPPATCGTRCTRRSQSRGGTQSWTAWTPKRPHNTAPSQTGRPQTRWRRPLHPAATGCLTPTTACSPAGSPAAAWVRARR